MYILYVSDYYIYYVCNILRDGSYKYNMRTLTIDEQQEFNQLERTQLSRGFLLSKELLRWNYLFDILAKNIITKTVERERIEYLMKCN